MQSTSNPTARMAETFTTGDQFQDPRNGEWLTVTATRPAGPNLVRLYCTGEQGQDIAKTLQATAYRIAA